MGPENRGVCVAGVLGGHKVDLMPVNHIWVAKASTLRKKKLQGGDVYKGANAMGMRADTLVSS